MTGEHEYQTQTTNDNAGRRELTARRAFLLLAGAPAVLASACVGITGPTSSTDPIVSSSSTPSTPASSTASTVSSSS